MPLLIFLKAVTIVLAPSPLILPSTDLLNRALTLYGNNFRVSVTVASFFSGSNGLLLFYFKQLWKWLHKAMPSLCLVVHVFLISALVAEFSLDLRPLYSSSEVTRFKTSSISTTSLWLWWTSLVFRLPHHACNPMYLRGRLEIHIAVVSGWSIIHTSHNLKVSTSSLPDIKFYNGVGGYVKRQLKLTACLQVAIQDITNHYLFHALYMALS